MQKKVPGSTRRTINLFVHRGKDESLTLLQQKIIPLVMIVTTPCKYTWMCSLLCGYACSLTECGISTERCVMQIHPRCRNKTILTNYEGDIFEKWHTSPYCSCHSMRWFQLFFKWVLAAPWNPFTLLHILSKIMLLKTWYVAQSQQKDVLLSSKGSAVESSLFANVQEQILHTSATHIHAFFMNPAV